MRSDTVYKQAFNQMITLLQTGPADLHLPSENALRQMLDVSRTTVRKVLHELALRGLIREQATG